MPTQQSTVFPGENKDLKQETAVSNTDLSLPAPKKEYLINRGASTDAQDQPVLPSPSSFKSSSEIMPIAPKQSYLAKDYKPNLPETKLPDNYVPFGTGSRPAYWYNQFLKGVGQVGAGAQDLVNQLQANAVQNFPGIVKQIQDEQNVAKTVFQETNGKDALLQSQREDEISKVRNAPLETLGLPVSQDKQSKFDKEFWTSAVGGLSASAPTLLAMPFDYGTSMFLQAYDGGLESINNTKEGKSLPESTKTIFAATVGMAQAALMKVGIDKIFSGQSAENIAISTLKKLMAKTDGPITADMYEAALKEATTGFKNKILNSGKDVLKAGATGFGYGAGGELTQVLAELEVNKSTGKEVFDAQSFGDVSGRILSAGLKAGVGGLMLGGLHIPFSDTRNYISEKVSEAKTPEDFAKLKDDLGKAAQEAGMPPEDIDGLGKVVDSYTKAASSVPDEVVNKKAAVDKIVERDQVKDAIVKKTEDLTKVDDAFKPDIQKELALLSEQEAALNQAIVDAGSKKSVKPVKQDPNAPVQVNENYRTFNFGRLEGTPQTTEMDEEIKDTFINRPNEKIGGGESFNEATNRGLTQFKKDLETLPKNSVIVTHNSMFGLLKAWDKKGRPAELDKEFREFYTTQEDNAHDSFYTVKGKNGPIHIIRHGETEDNVNGNFRSSTTTLTSEGKKDIDKVSNKFVEKGIHPTKIVSSDLDRAKETANGIFSKTRPIEKSKSSQNTIYDDMGLEDINSLLNDDQPTQKIEKSTELQKKVESVKSDLKAKEPTDLLSTESDFEALKEGDRVHIVGADDETGTPFDEIAKVVPNKEGQLEIVRENGDTIGKDYFQIPIFARPYFITKEDASKASPIKEVRAVQTAISENISHDSKNDIPIVASNESTEEDQSIPLPNKYGEVRNSNNQVIWEKEGTSHKKNKRGHSIASRDEKGDLIPSNDKETRFDILNSPEYLQIGDKVRLVVNEGLPYLNEHPELANDSKEIPIRIETEVNGQWINVGQLPTVKVNSPELASLREKFFASKLPMETTVSLKHNGQIWTLKDKGGKSVKNPIEVLKGLNNGKLELAIGQMGKASMPNGNFDAQARDLYKYNLKDGGVYGIIKAPDNTYYPIRLDVRNLNDKEVESIVNDLKGLMVDYKAILNGDHSSWHGVSDKIGETVFIGSRSLQLSENRRHFAITPTGLTFRDRFVPYNAEGKIEMPPVMWSRLKFFLSDQHHQVELSKLNTPEYTEKLKGILSTDINPQQPFFNSVIELDHKISIVEGKKVKETKEDAVKRLFGDVTKGKFRAVETSSVYRKYDPIKANIWLLEHLPNVPVRTLERIHEEGVEAWGMFKNSIIHLAEHAEEGTEYWEAMRAVYDLFLTSKEKSDVLREVQEETGSNTTEELEKDLAKAFMDYKMSNGRSRPKGKKARTFFQRLWDIIKSFGKRGWITLDELFEGIESKKYADKKYKPKEGEPKFREVSDFSSKAQEEITKSINYLFFDSLRQKESKGEFRQEVKIPDLYKEIKGTFEEVYKQSGDPEFKKIVDNFDRLIQEHVNYLKSFQYQFRSLDESNELDSNYTDSGEKFDTEKLSTLVNPKDRLTTKMKEYFLTLPDVIKNEDGEFEAKRNYLGLPTFVNFNTAYSFFKEKLSDVYSEQAMLDKLEASAKSNDLAAKVLSDYNQGSSEFKGQFWSAMSGTHYKYITNVHQGSSVQIFDTNRTELWREVQTDWKNGFYDTSSNKFLKYDSSRKLVFNIEGLKKLYSDYNDRLKRIGIEVSNSDREYVKTTLGKIGIHLSDTTLISSSQQQLIEGRMYAGGSTFKQIFGDSGRGSAGFMLKWLSQGKDIFSTGDQGILSTIKSLSQIESASQSDRFAGMFTNGDGKKVYSYNAPNDLTKTINKIKQSPENEIGKLMVSPIYNPVPDNSSYIDPWLKKIKEDSRARGIFDFRVFDITRFNEQRTGYVDFTPSDYHRASFDQLVNQGKDWGYFMEPSPADKSNVYFISFLKDKVSKDSKGKLFGPAVDNIFQTVVAEIARISRAEADIKTFKDHELVDTYHFHPETKNKRDRSGKAFEFNFFPTLKDIKELYDKDTRTLTVKGAALDKDALAIVREHIQDYLSQRVKDTVSDMEKFNIIKIKEGKLFSVSVDGKALNKLIGDEDSKIRQLIDHYAVNNVLGTLQITKLLGVDMAFYSDVLNMWKRWPQSHTPGIEPRIGKGGMNPDFNLSVVHDVKVDLTVEVTAAMKKGLIESGVTVKEASEIVKQYQDINSTDSQGFRTEARYQNVQEGLGTWPKQVHSVDKPFYYGKVIRNGLVIPTQIKYSSLELSQKFTKGFPILDDIRQRMEGIGKYSGKTPIDELVFTSANKVGISGAGDLDKLNDLIVQTIPSEGYRIPQVAPYKDDTDPKFPTQSRKFTISNVIKDGDYNIGSKKIKGQDVLDMFNNTLSANILDSYKQLESDLGMTTLNDIKSRGLDVTEDQLRYMTKDVANKIKEQLSVSRSRGGVDENQEKFLESFVNGDLPLWFFSDADANEGGLISSFRNDVIKQTMPGLMAVQFSDHGIHVEKNESLKPALFNPESGKVDPAEVVCSSHFFVSRLSKNGINSENFKDINGVLDVAKIPVELRTLLINRIPEQGKSSFIPSVIVKFLPEQSGDVAALPAAGVVQMGYDFDFDKVFIMQKDFKIKDSKPEPYKYDLSDKNVDGRWEEYKSIAGRDKVIRKALKEAGITRESTTQEIDRIFAFNTALKNNIEKELGASKITSDWTLGLWESLSAHVTETEFKAMNPYEQNTRQGRNNLLFDILYGIITDIKHYKELIYPNSIATMNSSAKKIRNLSGFSGDPRWDWLDSRHQRFIAFSNMEASKLRGTFSLAAASHALFTTVKNPITISEKYAPIFDGKVYSDLTRREDDNKDSISNNLMEDQTVMLDSAKKPLAGLLNLNTITGHVAILLSRLGLPLHERNLFITQPVIKDFVEEVLINGKSVSAVTKTIKGIVTSYNTKINALGGDYIDFKRDLFDLKFKDLKDSYVKVETPQWYRTQLEVLSTFLNLKEHAATDLGAVVKAMRVDDNSSRVIGTTSDHFFAKIDAISSILMGVKSIKGANQFFKSDSYFTILSQYGLQKAIDFTDRFFPWRRGSFVAVKGELTSIGLASNLSPDLSRDVSFQFLQYLYTHPSSPTASNRESINKLVKGEGSVPVRVKRIKDTLQSMKDKNPSFEVPTFFEEINADLDFKKINEIQSFRTSNLVGRTATERSAIQRSFKDLYRNGIEGIPGIKELLNDYANFVIVTSGFGYSSRSLLQTIPTEYWIESGHKEFANKLEKEVFGESLVGSGYVDQYVRHNFANDQMGRVVPTITLGQKGGFDATDVNTVDVEVKGDFEGDERTVKVPTSFKLSEESSSNLIVKKGDEGIVYPKYVRWFSRAEKKAYLYKFKGYSDIEGTVGVFGQESALGIPGKLFEYSFGQEHPESIVESNKLLPSRVLSVVKEEPVEITKPMNMLFGGISDEDLEDIRSQIEEGGVPEELGDLPELPKEEMHSKRVLEDSDKVIKEVSKKVEERLKAYFGSVGVRVEAVDDMKSRFDGDTIAVANLAQKIVTHINSEEGIQALPEEAAHFYTMMLDPNNPLLKRLLDLTSQSEQYKSVKADKQYQSLYKDDERKYLNEAAGKLIDSVIKKKGDSIIDEEFIKESGSLWSSIKATVKRLLERIRNLFSKKTARTLKDELNDIAEKFARNILTGNAEGLSDEFLTGSMAKTRESSKLSDVVERQKKILSETIARYRSRAVKAGHESVIKDLETLQEKVAKLDAIHAYSEFLGRAEKELAAINDRFEKNLITKTVLADVNRFLTAYHDLNKVGGDELFGELRERADKVVNMVNILDSKYIDMINSNSNEIFKALTSRSGNFVEQFNSLDPIDDISEFNRLLSNPSTTPDPLMQVADKLIFRQTDTVAKKDRQKNRPLEEAFEKLSKYKGTSEPSKLYEDFIQDNKGRSTGRWVEPASAKFLDERQKTFKRGEDESVESYRTRVANWMKSNFKTVSNYDEVVSRAKSLLTDFGSYNAWLNATHRQWINDDGETILFPGSSLQEPKDQKNLDSKYTRIQNSPALKDFYLTYKVLNGYKDGLIPAKHQMGNILPSIKAGFMEHIRRSGFGVAMKYWGKDLKKTFDFQIHNNPNAGMYDENGNPLNVIPVMFTAKLPVLGEKSDLRLSPEERTIDLVGGLKAMLHMAHYYEAMSEIQDDLELLKQAVKKRPVRKTDWLGVKETRTLKKGEKPVEEPVLEPGELSRAFSAYEAFIQRKLYGHVQIKQSVAGIDLTKIGHALKGLTLMQNLAFNYLSGANNIIYGKWCGAVEANGGRFFTKEESLKANGIYASMLPTISGKNNKLRAFMERFPILQHQRFLYDMEGQLSKKVSGTAMIFQSVGENAIQIPQVIAMLLNKKVGDTTLWDSLDVSSNGDLVLKKGINLKEHELVDYVYLMEGVLQQMHGRYNREDMNRAQQFILGSLLLQHRLWVAPAISASFTERHYEERMQGDVEGYRRTMYSTIFDLLKGKSEAAKTRWSDPIQRASMRKFFMNAALLIGAVALEQLFVELSKKYPNHKNLNLFLAYELNRSATDGYIMEAPPFGAWSAGGKLMKSPVPVMSSLDDDIQFLIDAGREALPWVEERKKINQSGAHRGERKVYTSFRNIVPGWKQISRWDNVSKTYTGFKNK